MIRPHEITHQSFNIADGWCVGEVNHIAPDNIEVIWTDGINRQGVRVKTFSQIQQVINWLALCYCAHERGEGNVAAPSFIQDSDWIE